MMERSPRRPVLRAIALRATAARRVVGEGQAHAFHVEQAGVLLDQSVLGLGQDLDQGLLVEILQRGDHRQAADELRDQAEAEHVFGSTCRRSSPRTALFRIAHRRRRSRCPRPSRRGRR
jgi:hypothetical protein